MVHSDIKSKNVLLNGAMHAKISDVRMLLPDVAMTSLSVMLLMQLRSAVALVPQSQYLVEHMLKGVRRTRTLAIRWCATYCLQVGLAQLVDPQASNSKALEWTLAYASPEALLGQVCLIAALMACEHWDVPEIAGSTEFDYVSWPQSPLQLQSASVS